MSDLISDRKRQNLPANLRIGSPGKNYRSQEDVDPGGGTAIYGLYGYVPL